MRDLARYLSEMGRIRESGEASSETSFYPALSQLLNQIGARLDPSVHCVITPKNRGGGIPDGGLFLKRSLHPDESEDPLAIRVPERGVIEVKALSASLDRLAQSAQVIRYLQRYGQVLLTNYREFLLVRLGPTGEVVKAEALSIAASESAFWDLTESAIADLEEEVSEFLGRALLADAPLSSPQDLAGFLAAYARIARTRIEKVGMTRELETLKTALEDALGLRFEGQSGDEFFRSALVQTLFYGVFASWVNWSNANPTDRVSRFSWRTAGWTFKVPMVRVLFDQLATPSNLPAGLDEILNWTEDVFSRIDRDQFFERFERREAIQYFYEPFLEAYDPKLRRELGVWYTPPEVVRYMVARVHEALQRDLGIELGLADDRVHVLDPCTGTGSFLIEALRTATEVLEEVHGDDLVAQQVKEAALQRFHGFEILPAPFIITHLQLGLFLAELGAPLEGEAGERPSVYLTNALTGWVDDPEQLLPFEEFRTERQAAGDVKRAKPILVVIGNPPYNGFTGVGEELEGDLVAPYKEGLSESPWEITKNKLDDYYVRFFRVAERRIAELTGRGIISFISNFGWLGDPSAVLMRRHLLNAFDRIYVDNLNGDSRETGKKTPDGDPDPSIFSSKLSRSGIQVGAAISLLVRDRDSASRAEPKVMYRDLWGPAKAAELEESLDRHQDELPYEELLPAESNWYRLRRWRPRPGYESWPSLVDLARVRPELGLNENRGEALIDNDRGVLGERLKHFLDEELEHAEVEPDIVGGLLEGWSGYSAGETREKLLAAGGFAEQHIGPLMVRPFDLKWAYLDGRAKLWNRSRPKFQAAARVGSDFLLCRKRSPRALDGAAFLLSASLVDQHVLHKDAYAISLLLAHEDAIGDTDRLFELKREQTTSAAWRPNLSRFAAGYLAEMGYGDLDTSRHSARALWLHTLAIGYSPLYLEENADALCADWPRIPLPDRRELLDDSAALGARLGALLDIGTPLPGLDTSTVAHLSQLGNLVRDDGRKPQPADLAVTAGWASVQNREQKSGAISRIVMPSSGRVMRREAGDGEWPTLSPAQRGLLGEEVMDVYLNATTCWRGIPEAAWNFKIGGFQVLRKWLSYRDEAVLGRSISREEARQFQSIARRLTELVLLTSDLDANYRAATGSVDQESLIDFATEEG
jgi:hypothetical protein